MSNTQMTGCTLYLGVIGFMESDIMSKHIMAAPAVLFCYFHVHFVYPDRFMVIIRCKSIAVIPAVNGLYSVFADRCIWCMAVIAGSNRTMRGFLPRIILVIHYMTVIAGCRVIKHVRIPFGIVECSRAQPDNNSYTN